jgi:hypothetical protein
MRGRGWPLGARKRGAIRSINRTHARDFIGKAPRPRPRPRSSE